MKLDILVFAAHPDDAELSCAGTLLKYIALGKKAGIVDLTRGELGTRGSAEIRMTEANASTKILGISVRENLGFADGFFQNDKTHQLEIIKMIRRFQPEIIFANAIDDRHPDHGKAAQLVSDSCFLSGLIKIETEFEPAYPAGRNKKQDAWRPKTVYNYIQDRYIQPAFVIDISEFMEKKMEAIKCYRSQFYDASSIEPATYISSEGFLDTITARAAKFGKSIGVKYAEGFTSHKVIGVNDLFSLR